MPLQKVFVPFNMAFAMGLAVYQLHLVHQQQTVPALDGDILRQGDVPVARATSRWLLVSAATGKAARVTDAVRAAYELDDRVLFDTPIPSNGKTPAGTPAAFSAVVGRRDIDTNHHVNNIHYLDYALEALPQEVFDHLPGTVEVAYRRQILEGTPIRCLYTLTEDGRHQVEIQSGGEKVTRHAFVWFYERNE